MSKVVSMVHRNAHHAIQRGNAAAPAGVAWNQILGGWQVYDLSQGCPSGLVPEFFCLRSGLLPIALTEPAAVILCQLFTRAA